jgi:hypothetical protein
MNTSQKLYESAQNRFNQSMQTMMTLLIGGFSLHKRVRLINSTAGKLIKQ